MIDMLIWHTKTKVDRIKTEALTKAASWEQWGMTQRYSTEPETLPIEVKWREGLKLNQNPIEKGFFTYWKQVSQGVSHGFGQIVKDDTPLFDTSDNGSKVVIHDDHIRGVL